MENELMNIKNNAVSLILDAGSEKELEEIKLQFLGKSGSFTLLVKEIAKLPLEKRPEIGVLANEVKKIIEEAIDNATTQFTSKKIERIKKIDVTEPGIKPPLGHLHLVTQAIEEITAIFEKIGFTRVRYPEIEFDWYAFEALNFPENHPARDDWETFFIDQEPDPKKALYYSRLTPQAARSGRWKKVSCLLKCLISPKHIAGSPMRHTSRCSINLRR